MRCAQLAPVLRTIGTILGIIRRRPLQRAALLGRSGGHGRGGKNGDTSADNDRIELYYAPSVGRGGCRLLDVLQLLAGAAGNLKNREAGNPTDNLQACRPAAQLDNAEASGRPRIDPYCSSHRAADAHSLCPRYPTGSPRRLAEAIAKPNQAVASRREQGRWPRMTRGYVPLWSAQGLRRCRKRGPFRTVLRRIPQRLDWLAEDPVCGEPLSWKDFRDHPGKTG